MLWVRYTLGEGDGGIDDCFLFLHPHQELSAAFLRQDCFVDVVNLARSFVLNAKDVLQHLYWPLISSNGNLSLVELNPPIQGPGSDH